MNASWSVGDDYAVVWDGGYAMVAGSVAMDAVVQLWQQVQGGVDVGGFLQALSETAHANLLAMPHFALVLAVPQGFQVAVRGEFIVDIRTDQAQERISANGVSTWIERGVPGAGFAVLSRGSEPPALRFPIVAGVVLAGVVTAGDLPPHSSGQESAPAATPDPWAQPAPQVAVWGSAPNPPDAEPGEQATLDPLPAELLPQDGASLRQEPENDTRPESDPAQQEAPEQHEAPEQQEDPEPQEDSELVPGPVDSLWADAPEEQDDQPSVLDHPTVAEPEEDDGAIAESEGFTRSWDDSDDSDEAVQPEPDQDSDSAAAPKFLPTLLEYDEDEAVAEDPVDHGQPAMEPELSPEKYEALFGATVLRPVEDAAVREDDAQPSSEAPANASPAGGEFISAVPQQRAGATQPASDYSPLIDLGDHDGRTVFFNDPPPADSPFASSNRQVAGELVLGVRCANGHSNPPHRSHCRVCGDPVTGEPEQLERPALGWLRTSAGESLELTTPVIAGRSPRAERVQGPVMPRLLSLPHGHISGNHLEIRFEGWNVLACDLHSRNGTFLRRRGEPPVRLPEQPLLLMSDDVLDLGRGVQLSFQELP